MDFFTHGGQVEALPGLVQLLDRGLLPLSLDLELEDFSLQILDLVLKLLLGLVAHHRCRSQTLETLLLLLRLSLM